MLASENLVVSTRCKGIGREHRVSLVGLPIEQVLGEYSLFLAFRRGVALLVSTRVSDDP